MKPKPNQAKPSKAPPTSFGILDPQSAAGRVHTQTHVEKKTPATEKEPTTAAPAPTIQPPAAETTKAESGPPAAAPATPVAPTSASATHAGKRSFFGRLLGKKQEKEKTPLAPPKTATTPDIPSTTIKKEEGPPAPAGAALPAPTPKSSILDPKKEEKKPDLSKLTAKLGAPRKSGLQRALDSLNNIGLGKEKLNFIENLAILLNSGLSVVDALKTIEMELKLKPMKKMLARIIDEVESGMPLWMAMDNQNFFSSYALALIRIGEESGSLSKNMEYLAIQQEKDRSLRSKVKMAMIYPSIVLVLTIGITLGLAWFVLPELVGVLLSLNAELPLVTRIIIWVANFFKLHGTVAVPLMFGLMLLIYLVCRFTSLRGPAQQFIFKLPGIGTMAKSATIARFGVILGSLLRAGVPLVESIRSMAEVTDTVYYKRLYFRLAKDIEVGQSFASSFESIKESKKLIPASVQQLIITGERSGRIAEMLMRIADIYEKKAEEAAQRLPVVLEPMLLIFIGGLVGTIAFAIIVPIYSIVGSVGR